MGVFRNIPEGSVTANDRLLLEDNLNEIDQTATIEPWTKCRDDVQALVKRGANTNLFVADSLICERRDKHMHHLDVVEYNSCTDTVITGQESHLTFTSPHRVEKKSLSSDVALFVVSNSLKRYYIYTKDLKIHLYNMAFKCESSMFTSKPLLSLNFDEESGYLIAGCINRIIFYKQDVCMDVPGVEKIILKVARTFSVPESNQLWFYHIYYHSLLKRVYAACDSSVVVFDFNNGKEIETLTDRHVGTISRVCYLNQSTIQYFITGSTDGTIKVWQAFKHLLQSYDAHRDEVTGLVAHSRSPMFISSSKDGTVKGFSVRTCEEMFRLDLQEPVLGLKFMTEETFICYTIDLLQIMNLNLNIKLCNIVRGETKSLERIQLDDGVQRIMAVLDDTSIVFFSPVTGNTITITLPTLCMANELAVRFSRNTNQVYCLFDNGEIWLFSLDTNPSLLVDIWYPAEMREDYFNYIEVIDFAIDNEIETFVFAGSKNGQIHVLSPSVQGRSISHVQAHSQPIVQLLKCQQTGKLVSICKDRVAKIWNVRKDDSGRFIHLFKTIELQSEASLAKLIENCLIVCCPNNHVSFYDFEREEIEVYRSHKEDKHCEKITAIAWNSSLGVLVSSSRDMSIKVWDRTASLHREICVGAPVTSCAFMNDRGDLCLGLRKNIYVLKLALYFPFSILNNLLCMEFEDDKIEHPMPFDSTLEFLVYNSDLSRARKYLKKERVVKDACVKAFQVEKSFKSIIKKTIHEKEQRQSTPRKPTTAAAEKAQAHRWQKLIDVRIVNMKKKRKMAHAVAYQRFLRHRLFDTVAKVSCEEITMPSLINDSIDVQDLEDVDIAGVMRSLTSNYLQADKDEAEIDGSEKENLNTQLQEAIPDGWGGEEIRVEDVIPRPMGQIVDGGLLLDNGTLIEKETLSRNNIRVTSEGKLLQGNGRPAEVKFDCIILEDNILIFDNNAPLKGDLNRLLSGRRSTDHGGRDEVQKVIESVLYKPFPKQYGEHALASIRHPRNPCPEKRIACDGHIPNSIIRRILFAKSILEFSKVEQKRWKPKKSFPKRAPKPKTPSPEPVPEKSVDMGEIDEFLADMEVEEKVEEVVEEVKPEVRKRRTKKPAVMLKKTPTPPPQVQPEEQFEDNPLNAAIQKVVAQQWYSASVDQTPSTKQAEQAVQAKMKVKHSRRLSQVLQNLVTIMKDSNLDLTVREEAMESIGFLHKEVDVPGG